MAGLPVGIGAFLMGIFSSVFLQTTKSDSVITVFSTLGISSLFLYAGLELNLTELKKNYRPLLIHLLIKAILLSAVALVIQEIFSFSLQVSALVSLGLLTPSTGFILDTLPSTKLSAEQKLWVKNKAIASEILALLLLLVIQSSTPAKLALSMGVLVILIIILPILFHFIAKRISFTSSGADFSLLLLLAVVTGTITKKLGAYYLVGAFIVGFTVSYYEEYIAKSKNHKFEDAAKFFAAFFMPFYFFKAGLGIDINVLTIQSALLGVLLCLSMLPIRIGVPAIQMMLSSNERSHNSLPITISLLPTLVFGLILTDLIRQTNSVGNNLLGGLIFYTLIMTLLPSFLLRYVLKRTDLIELTKVNEILSEKNL